MNEAVSGAVLRILLIQSCVGAGLILMMVLLRRMMRDKVSSRLIHFLWLVVAFRMLFPVQLPNPVVLKAEVPYTVMNARIAEGAPGAIMPWENIAADEDPYVSQAAETAVNGDSEVKVETAGFPSVSTPGISFIKLNISNLIMLLWFAGTSCMAVYTVAVNRRFQKRVMAGAQMLSADSPVPVLLSMVPSPCLVGIFKPRILVNSIGAQPEHFSFVLRHELCHYRGLDHVWNLLGIIMLALFWFNPLVWVAESLRKKDCERACDERVTKAFKPEETVAYAKTLIALSSYERVRIAPAAMMASTFSDMKRRVLFLTGERRIRRWTCMLFAMLIFFVSFASFATGEPLAKECTLPEVFESKPAYCPVKDGLWIAFEGKLYKQTGKNKLEEAAEASPALIAADESSVCLFIDNVRQFQVLDNMGLPVSVWSLPNGLDPIKLEIAGGKLAILARRHRDANTGLYTEQGLLYLMDLHTGDLSEIKMGNVLDISADGIGSLMVLHLPESCSEVQVTRLNPVSLSQYTIASAGTEARFIAAEAGVYYILTYLGLDKYKEPSAVPQRMSLPFPLPLERLEGLRVANGMLYVWDTVSGRLLVSDVKDKSPVGKTALTIVNRCGTGAAFDSAWKAFEKQHPDVEIRDVMMDFDFLSGRLNKGDEEIDIICECSSELVRYGRQGVLLPLSEDPLVMDVLHQAEWIPFEAYYSSNGNLYGVPVLSSYHLFQVDPDRAGKTGFDMPESPYTWSDLYEAAAKAGLGQPGKPVLLYDLVRNPMLIRHYTMAKAVWEGKLWYDTPGFREDMEAYKKMVRENMIVLLDLGRFSADSCVIQNSQSQIVGKNAAFMPMVDGCDGVEVSCYGFGINQKSKNKELAIEFLVEYAKPEHHYKNRYGEVEAMLLQDADMYDHTPYGDPYVEETNDYAAQVDLWKHAMDKWIFVNKELLMGNVLYDTDALQRYLEDDITLDTFIGILQSRADEIQNK